MAYRYGDRLQAGLLPQSIEEYVAENDPARAYDAFVEALDFRDLGIEIDPHKVGNAEYDPRIMLKLLVYGYSYGVKSSRKLERECHHNLSFIWLMGGLKPDHKTIAEFRRNNKKALKKVLRHCARICIKLDLIAGNVLFVDGTKLRANAGRDRTHERAYYERLLAKLDSRIDQLLADCEAADRSEEDAPSYVAMDKELAKSRNLKERIRGALNAIASAGKKQVNQTDPDCAMMHSIQGNHTGYNVQSVIDDEHGLIVQAEAVSDANDVRQFARQIQQANELLEESCKVACADAGYADTAELEKVDQQGIKVIVPSQRQSLHEPEDPFSKSRFTYNKEQDCYICPEGHRLLHSFTNKRKGKRQYRMEDSELCRRCRYFGRCTKSHRGRNIIRLRNEEVKLKLEAQYEEASSQAVYSRRKARVEHPFGHIKRNLKTDAFLLRGQEGVQAETSLLATCFNMARMITILGIGTLKEKLAGFRMVPEGC
jgi:transposase